MAGGAARQHVAMREGLRGDDLRQQCDERLDPLAQPDDELPVLGVRREALCLVREPILQPVDTEVGEPEREAAVPLLGGLVRHHRAIVEIVPRHEDGLHEGRRRGRNGRHPAASGKHSNHLPLHSNHK